MFKNRTLEVKMVKKPKSQDEDTETSESSLEEKLVVVPVIVGDVIKKIGVVICAYVVLDTARQVVVAKTTQV